MFINKNINYKLTKKVALFANARDETHIKEWATHHLLLGFDNIIIFDHKSKVPLKKIFDNFDTKINIINASKIENPVKIKLMNIATKIATKLNVDWFIYLDIDEFIILNKHSNIKDFLNIYNHAHSLGINWLMFGSNNLIKDPEGLILENYTKSELLLNKHVKSFVRPNEVLYANNPHFYNIKTPSKMYGINNKILKNKYCFNELSIHFKKSPIYIAHYIYQSEESYINRKLLLPTDDTNIFRNGNINDVKHIHNLYNNSINLQPQKYIQHINDFLSTKELKPSILTSSK